MRRLLNATMLVSASAIAYEILLMRVLTITQWHHFAWMIISLALLGYGASGTAVALGRERLEANFEAAFAGSALLFSVSMIGCLLLVQQVPFNALEIVWNPGQFGYLALIYLLFAAPFFFAASCIALAFACRPALIERIYFFDLLGAGLGALALIGLLFLLRPVPLAILLALLALAASRLSAAGGAGGKPLAIAQGAWTLALAVLLFTPWTFGLTISPFKGLPQALAVVDSRVVAETASPLGLLTVVESPRVPVRHAPGLSFNTPHLPPEQLAVFIDGDGMSAINRFEPVSGPPAYLGDTTAALPWTVLRQPRVLILGAGAGTDVLLALHQGAARIDAVELNPRMVELAAGRFRDFAGPVYDDPRVNVHIGEARGFMTRSRERYDLVHIGLLDSFAASGSGIQSLNESYLYTVEAVRSYLEHLSPGGILAITRWLRVPPRDSLKLAATVIRAMRDAGIGDPGARLALVRSWNTVTLLARNGPFTAAETDALEAFASARSFDTAWYPGMTADRANRYNRLERPYLFEGVTALLGDGAGEFVSRYKFRIEPATDDRPYFFHFFRWRVLPEVLALRKQGAGGMVEWGYLVLVATLVQAIVLGGAAILLPLALSRRGRAGSGTLRRTAYFFALGLAFLFIEIAFIQKFILFLSHPLYSVAVVLAGFLVFAGLGSAWSSRPRASVNAAVGGIILLALTYVVLLPPLFGRLIGLPDPLKIGISLLFIAPLAFCMGMPFPLGLRRAAAAAPGFIPWAWGVNGFASVISTALAALLAIQFGFTFVLLAALALYALAAWLFRAETAS